MTERNPAEGADTDDGSGRAAPGDSLLPSLLQPWVWRMAWRDSRTRRRRLLIYALSVTMGIAALVTIHSLRASVDRAVAVQAKSLLGADVQITARQAFDEADVVDILGEVEQGTREISLTSMMFFPEADAARLVQVIAHEDGFPFYGTIETEPADAWQRHRREGGVLLEPGLMEQYGLSIGDTVELGKQQLEVIGAVTRAMGATRFASFAPTVMVRWHEMEGSGLAGLRSLARYRLNLRVDDSTAGVLRERYRERGWRFETPADRADMLGDALDNLQQFLGLLGMAALVLGSLGVATAIHAHVTRSIPSVAVLRCLGCSRRLAFGIYLAQALCVGLAGALLGIATGVGLHLGLLVFYKDELPLAVELAPVWGVVLRTGALGAAVCLVFALLPLWRVRGVSPAEVLRRLPSRRVAGGWKRWPLLVLPLFGLLVWLGAADGAGWLRGLVLTGALAVAFGLLTLLALGLAVLARHAIRPGWRFELRQGIANLHRPHNQTLTFTLSLGLGTFLILTVFFGREQVLQKIDLGQWDDSPNLYLVDVQADQVEPVNALVGEAGLRVLESAPMVAMRLESVRGVPVEELQRSGQIPRWVLTREFRSSYRDRLNATESIVAGEWSGEAVTPGEVVPVSLEQDIARDLGVGLGDRMMMDVQGIPVEIEVTSLREVDWSRFNLNFFMLFPPGVLEDAPGFHVVTTRVADDQAELQGALQRELATRFPNVSAIDLKLILGTVRSVLDRVVGVVQVLAGFTVLSGLAIVVAVVLNGREQRRRESVLLRTLGASSAQVRLILVVEAAALGAVAAAAGCLLAAAAHAGMALALFDASPWPPMLPMLMAIGLGMLVAVVSALALSRDVCRASPLMVLRGEG